jgi:hypothetical protein
LWLLSGWLFPAYARSPSPIRGNLATGLMVEMLNFRCNFSHFYTFFTPTRAIFSSSFYPSPYTASIKNNTSGGVP